MRIDGSILWDLGITFQESTALISQPHDIGADATNRAWLFCIAGVCLGLAVPAMFLGKAAMAPFFGFGVICAGIGLMRAPDRGQIASGLTAPLARAAYLLIACLFISAILSDHASKSLAMPFRVGLTMAAAYLCFLVFRRSPLALMLAGKTLIVAAFIALSIVVFADYFQGASDAVRHILGLPTPFSAPRAYKMFASATICFLPIVVWFGIRVGSFWKVLSLLTIPLTGLVIYGNGVETSQSAIAGLLGGSVLLVLVFIALRLNTWSRRALIALVVLIALAVGTYILTHVPAPPVVADQTPRLPLPDWHRQVIWGFTLDIFLHHPVFGVGPNTVNMMPGASDYVPGLNQEYIPAHPHNFVLEIASESGVVGLLALVTVLIVLLKMVFQIAARSQAARRGDKDSAAGQDVRAAAYTAIFLIGAFWTSALSNFSIWSAWWLASFMLLITFPLAAAQSRTQNSH
jgi:O-antigen ligase